LRAEFRPAVTVRDGIREVVGSDFGRHAMVSIPAPAMSAISGPASGTDPPAQAAGLASSSGSTLRAWRGRSMRRAAAAIWPRAT
jgi:hypothetical protein